MIELTIFEAIVWVLVIVCLASFVIVPLTIRYLTPDIPDVEKQVFKTETKTRVNLGPIRYQHIKENN